MGMIVAIGVVIAGIVGAALSQLLADEFEAWAPHIANKLIRLAVSRLPERNRERMREEWHSHLDEIPGQIGKIVAAIGFLIASRDPNCSSSNIEKPKPKWVNSDEERQPVVFIVGAGVSWAPYANARDAKTLEHDATSEYDLNRIMQDYSDSLDGRGN